jgi:hypothetical protein
MFGLHSTKDLPKLRELDELFQHKAAELAGGLDISVKTTSGELLTKIQAMVDNEHKIHEHERMREEGRHEDEISLLDAATIAEMRTVESSHTDDDSIPAKDDVVADINNDDEYQEESHDSSNTQESIEESHDDQSDDQSDNR